MTGISPELQAQLTNWMEEVAPEWRSLSDDDQQLQAIVLILTSFVKLPAELRPNILRNLGEINWDDAPQEKLAYLTPTKPHYPGWESDMRQVVWHCLEGLVDSLSDDGAAIALSTMQDFINTRTTEPELEDIPI